MYERIVGAKVNFDKSEGLRLGAWRGSDTLPGPFRWSDESIYILGVWFGPDLELEQNWSEVQAKVNAQVGIWLSRRLSLKGRARGCAVYVFPLILYRLAVLPLPEAQRHGRTAEEIRSHWNWVPRSSFLNKSEFSLTWRLVRNALPLLGLNYKAGQADMPDCARCGSGLEETVEHAFYYCERVHPFWDHVGEWTARIEPKQLVLLDVGYVVDNILPPFQGKKRVVFLAILAVARMGIWTTRNKGLYDDANFSHRDLVLYFRHQLRVKIRCDRKCLDRIKFSKRWVNAASLVVRKGAMLESSFPPLPAHGIYGTGP